MLALEGCRVSDPNSDRPSWTFTLSIAHESCRHQARGPPRRRQTCHGNELPRSTPKSSAPRARSRRSTVLVMRLGILLDRSPSNERVHVADWPECGIDSVKGFLPYISCCSGAGVSARVSLSPTSPLQLGASLPSPLVSPSPQLSAFEFSA